MGMVESQLERRGIRDKRVLQAMRSVSRTAFVPADREGEAEEDRPLPIGCGQTISQPYIVALMTERVRPEPTDRALDVGTGSGYQAAILSRLVTEVESIEYVPELAEIARQRLESLGYDNVDVRCGDGYQGYRPRAPYDVIVVAAAPEEVPPELIRQLGPGGRMVIPVGSRDEQTLWLYEKDGDGEVTREKLAPVMFVPLVASPSDHTPPKSNRR